MTASYTPSAGARACKIRLIIFDVDGVLTDGGIWLFPAPAPSSATAEHAARMEGKGGYGISSQSMVEAKGFNAHDGTGISLAKLAQIKCGIITKRISETVALRARDLRVEYLYQGISNKRETLEEIMAKEGLKAEEIAFVGDDVIDLPAMRRCGLAIAGPNAREEVKDEAHIVTDHCGGEGAVRDAVEYILRAQDKLDNAIEQYIHDRSPVKR
jgi:3-deoxy-D-manno-octulosonate 8-phosphate phosphatase (KDO 8-P phosphatase)